MDEAVKAAVRSLQEPSEDSSPRRPGQARPGPARPRTRSGRQPQPPEACTTLGLCLVTVRGKVLARPPRRPEGPALLLPTPPLELAVLAGGRASRGAKGPGTTGDRGERRTSAERGPRGHTWLRGPEVRSDRPDCSSRTPPGPPLCSPSSSHEALLHGCDLTPYRLGFYEAAAGKWGTLAGQACLGDLVRSQLGHRLARRERWRKEESRGGAKEGGNGKMKREKRE